MLRAAASPTKSLRTWGTGPSSGPEQADLAGALTDAKSEQQGREQKRRGDEECRHAQEESPEIHALRHRLVRQCFHRDRLEASRGCGQLRSEPRRDGLGVRFSGDPERREFAKAVPPEFLPVGEMKKELRRAALLAPEGIVLVADEVLLNGNPRLPVAAVFRFTDAREIGSP